LLGDLFLRILNKLSNSIQPPAIGWVSFRLHMNQRVIDGVHQYL